MSEECKFCPAEQYTFLFIKDYGFKSDPPEVEVPVCVDCFRAYKDRQTADHTHK